MTVTHISQRPIKIEDQNFSTHGSIGLIYMLMRSIVSVKHLQCDKQLMLTIEASVLKIVKALRRSKFCIDLNNCNEDSQYYFCNSTAASIPMLVLAA
jgi:hypothetical protein